MTSIAIKGARYIVKPEEADKYGPFGRTFLAEGDSWMDASVWNQGSLPEFLARAYNKAGESNLIINIATSGHTLTKIVDMMQGDFVWWLEQQTYDGILLSAGGNDFIDAARDPDPGKGILVDWTDPRKPGTIDECIDSEAVAKLVDYLDRNFKALFAALRASSKNADTPVYLNCYETPTARDAPAIRGISGPCLYTAFVKNGIPPELWPGLTQVLFAKIQEVVKTWAQGEPQLVVVNTTGLLVPARPGTSGNSNDWVNEIHPNEAGWKKQAARWITTIK